MTKFQQSSQGLHELKRCEVLEMMELQLERRKREELRLRAELDTAGQELSALKISNIQIQAEVLLFTFLNSYLFYNLYFLNRTTG